MQGFIHRFEGRGTVGGGLKTKTKQKESTGFLSHEETLVDVRLQEPGVTISGHQAVDELLRRVE